MDGSHRMTAPTTPPATSRRAGRVGPFRHPAFSIYWGGGFVSNLGTWLQAIAGSVYVYELTGSSFAVGVFNFAGFIPILLFSVWGGQVSDRFDRRSVVVVTHVVSLVVAALLAAVTVLGVATELQLIAATFVLNTLWAIGKPSLVSMIPNLVPREEIQDAVALNQLQFIGGQIVGPTLAALLLATAGPGLAFTTNALTYVGPIVAMAYLVRVGRGGPDKAERRRRAEAAATSAVAFVREHVWVPAFLVGIVATAAAMELQRTLAPELVSRILGEDPSSTGLLVAAQAGGSAVALLLFMPIRRRGWSHRAALAGYLFQAAGVVGVAFAPSLVGACLSVSLIGFGFSLCFPVLTAVLQEGSPDRLRGRVMSYHQMAHLGNRPFTALAAGTVAAAFGVQLGMLAGLLLVPVGILALRTAWRAMEREAAAEAAAAAAGAT